MTTITVTLGVQQAARAIEALNAALAGEWSDGDFGWTQAQATQADRAADRIAVALYRAEAQASTPE